MIPISSPYITKKAKKYVSNCLRTNWISSQGKYINEFEKSSCKIRNECINLSKKTITNFNRRSSSLQRVNFSLNLYKIRSQYSHSNTNQKYKELKNFLTSFENHN